MLRLLQNFTKTLAIGPSCPVRVDYFAWIVCAACLLGPAAAYANETHHWITAQPSGNWSRQLNWDAPTGPLADWDTILNNTALVAGQTAVVSADSTVHSVDLSGTAGTMTIELRSRAVLTATDFFQIGDNGAVVGRGTLASNVSNGGLVSPASSANVLAIDGDFIQPAGGSLLIPIDGPGAMPGKDHGQLAVTQVASLDGTLDLAATIADPMIPGIREEFTIVTAGSRTGTFATVRYNGTELSADVRMGNNFRDHVGAGLFRTVVYTDTAVEFANLRTIPGDTNGNLIVGPTDLQRIDNLGAFPSNCGGGCDWTQGDFDEDNVVGASDVQSILMLGRFPFHVTVVEPDPPFFAADLLLEPHTGNLTIDTNGLNFTGYVINAAFDVFTGDPAANLGTYTTDLDNQISGQSDFVLNGNHDLGNVVGRPVPFGAVGGLTMTYTLEGRPGAFESNVIIMPEPATGVVFCLVLTTFCRRSGVRRLVAALG